MPTDPALDLIVQLTIDSTVQTPSRPGFGAALLMSSETPVAWGSQLVRRFASAQEVADAGFAAGSNTRRKVDAYFGQTPKPSELYIGRRMSKPTKKVEITIGSPAVGVVYSIRLNGVTYTFTAADNVAANVATGLAAAINAGASGYGKAAVGAVITLTASVPGVAPPIESWSAVLPTGPTAATITVKDVTTDPGIVADLDAARGTSLGGQPFGLLLDQAGPAEIDLADTWAQSAGMLFAYVTADDRVLDPGDVTDPISDSATEGLSFTLPIYSLRDYNNPIDAAILGRCFPYAPGSVNFAHKGLAVASVQTLSATQMQTVIDKGGNFYAEIQNASDFYPGQTAGDSWADEVIALAFANAEIKISMFEVFLSEVKVPYTNAGVALLRSALKNTLLRLSRAPYNILDPERPIEVTAPKIEELTAAQRATRSFGDMIFEAYLQGAINNVRIYGRVTP